MTGRVKTLVSDRAFGFIRCDETGRDYFFHDDDVDTDFELRIGDLVSFEPVEPQPVRGPRARAVMFAEGGAS